MRNTHPKRTGKVFLNTDALEIDLDNFELPSNYARALYKKLGELCQYTLEQFEQLQINCTKHFGRDATYEGKEAFLNTLRCLYVLFFRNSIELKPDSPLNNEKVDIQ